MSQIHYATGRRKSSAARVYLTTGSGKIVVNDFSTYVAVDRAIAAQAAARLNSGRVKGKSVKARLIEDERG